MKTAKEIVEERKKKGLNVLKIIKKMRNLSSVIIHLAFAALMTNDKKLAKKVLELEEEMDVLQYQLEMEVMLATRNENQAKNFIAINRIASAMEDLSDAAQELVDAIIRGFPVEPSVVDALREEAEIKIYNVTKARFAGKKISDLDGTYEIIAVKKGDEWKYMPKEDITLEVGDEIILRRK